MKRNRMKQCALVVVAVLAIAGVPHRALAEEAGTVLEEILTIMKKSGQITEEQKKALIERAEREAKQAQAEREKTEQERVASFTAGIENARPYLKSLDGNFRFELGGRFQLDYDAAEDTAKTTAGTRLTDQFVVRRARIEMRGTFFQWIDMLVECEFTREDSKGAGQKFCLNDAYLDFRFLPEIGLRVGQFKTPFSFEELSSDNTIDFVERSIINTLAPSRDVGAMLRGSLWSGIVAYDLGVFNGAASNGGATNNADTNSAKDIAGRVTLAPFKPSGNYWLKNFQVAGSFTWGDAGEGTTGPVGQTGAHTANRFVFFSANQPVRGDRTRVGTDLAWAVGPASLKFEWSRQINERNNLGLKGANLDDLVATGWYVSGTWLLTGEDKPLVGPVVPKRSFNPVAGNYGIGAWEIGLRYAELKFESDDPIDFFDGNINNGIPGGGRTAENGVEALTAGINWYLNSRVRYMINWTQYWYDNALGTPFSCIRQGGCNGTQLRRAEDPTSYEFLTRIQLFF